MRRRPEGEHCAKDRVAEGWGPWRCQNRRPQEDGASAGAQKKIVAGKEGVKIRHTIEWRGQWKAESWLLKFVMEKKVMKSFCFDEDAARWAAVLNDEERHKDDREDIFTQENIKVKMQNLRQHQKMGAHNKTLMDADLASGGLANDDI